jgi:hypothetical protein
LINTKRDEGQQIDTSDNAQDLTPNHGCSIFR